MKHLFFLIPILLLFSCKKQTQFEIETPVLPCAGQTLVNADFTMEENFPDGDPRYTISDTVFEGKQVRFKALYPNGDYKWIINSQVYSGNDVEIDFGNEVTGAIPVTLVVKRQAGNTCFPEDDGYDSIVKQLTFVPFSDDLTTEGLYRMAEINSTDSIDIFVDYDSCGSLLGKCLTISNYDGNGAVIFEESPFNVNYRQIWYFIPGSTNQMGNVYCGADGKASMEFRNGNNVKMLKGRRM